MPQVCKESMQPVSASLLKAMHRMAKEHNQQPGTGILATNKAFIAVPSRWHLPDRMSRKLNVVALILLLNLLGAGNKQVLVQLDLTSCAPH